jgi:hypothetical protein
MELFGFGLLDECQMAWIETEPGPVSLKVAAPDVVGCGHNRRFFRHEFTVCGLTPMRRAISRSNNSGWVFNVDRTASRFSAFVRGEGCGVP